MPETTPTTAPPTTAPPTTAETFPKICNCCGATYTAAAWATLPSIGIIDDRDKDPAHGERIELRNCTGKMPGPEGARCQSTLSVVLVPALLADE